MATAAEQQSIIQLVVGMVNAAPGADILAELEELIDLGMTIEEVAIAITANPAWSGDTGLFPDYLPNAVFAEAFLTQLIGSEVTEDYLEEAVAEMTASLNAGDSRGAAINDAIDALAATDSADDDLGDAATALANKTEVATYYSVELMQSSDDLDDLMAVVMDVTSDEDAVADGEAAVDDVIAGAQPVVTLINNLGDANDAVTAFLVTADGDDKTTTTATAEDVANGIDDANEDIGDAVDAFGNVVTKAAYEAASEGLQAAYRADQITANAATSKGLATTLAAAAKATAAVKGLDAAIAAHSAATDANDAAIDEALLSAANLVAEMAAFGVASGDTVTNDLGGAGVQFTSNGVVVIGLTTAGTFIEIKDGVDETTNPGITALYGAAVANFLSIYVSAPAAEAALEAATDFLQNLDLDAQRTIDLAAVDTAMQFVDAALATKPTNAEIAAEQASLDAGVAALSAAISALTVGADDTATQAKVAALILAAQEAGFLDDTAGVGTVMGDAIQAAFDNEDPDTADGDTTDDYDTSAVLVAAKTAALAALATAGTGNNAEVFEALNDTYEATGSATAADATTPLTLAYGVAALASGGQALLEAAFAADIAALGAAGDLIDALEVLTDLVDDATDAFGDAGFEEPITLSGALAVGTSDDDVFVSNDTDSQIIAFAGDDILYLGEDLVINADTTAGDEGDNSVLEVWITGTSSATLTVETSEFGSDAADPETYTIVLTGVAAADVSIVDGLVTIA